EMKSQPFARDCVKVAEQTIIESNLLDPDTLAEWRKDAVVQVDEAVATAQKEAVPEADKEDWCALSMRELADDPEVNQDEARMSNVEGNPNAQMTNRVAASGHLSFVIVTSFFIRISSFCS